MGAERFEAFRELMSYGGCLSINAESIAAAALSRLAREGKFDAQRAQKAFDELGINTEKIDPAIA